MLQKFFQVDSEFKIPWVCSKRFLCSSAAQSSLFQLLQKILANGFRRPFSFLLIVASWTSSKLPISANVLPSR